MLGIEDICPKYEDDALVKKMAKKLLLDALTGAIGISQGLRRRT